MKVQQEGEGGGETYEGLFGPAGCEDSQYARTERYKKIK